MTEKFNLGDPVFVVQRDEELEPDVVVGYIFLTCVNGVAFVTPVINGHRDVEFILCYLRNLTQQEDELPMGAYPIGDCYPTRKAAEEAMKDELEN